ncbi:MAG: TVP38/TMEM64 family protein [Promethearchaeota archaeon]|nr:MAG: TVP38/TMEM64 family protein [Candidatus Lokiarchaeota archaeon]
MTENKEADSFSEKFKNYIKNILDFSQYDKKTIGFIIIFIGLVIFSFALLYYMYFIDETFLYRLVIELFVNPIFLLGFWGIFLFLLVMTLQGILVPIPSAIVILAAGIIWGAWLGGIMGVIGSMSAGLLCYYLAKRGGRPLAEKFVGKATIEMTDRFIEKYGIWAIIITRLIPFISFDAISYTAGIVKLDAKKYTIGTFIGVVPRAFFFSWLGASMNIRPPVNLLTLPVNEIEARAREFNNILLIIVVVISAIFISYILFSKIQEKRIEKGKIPGLINNNIATTPTDVKVDKEELEQISRLKDNP